MTKAAQIVAKSATDAEVKALASLKPDQQEQVARMVRVGQVESVKDAIAQGKFKAFGPDRPASKEPTEADLHRKSVIVWAETIGRWLSKSPSIDDIRRKHSGRNAERVVKAATELFESLKLWAKEIK